MIGKIVFHWSAAKDGLGSVAKVWDAVLRSGRWKYYDWTVKMDADTVFLPWNLRGALRLPQFVDAQNKPLTQRIDL